jgi:hypothetical protein
MGKFLPPSRPIYAHNCRFGAVLEEFEVRDALESIFYTQPEFDSQS